jgi:hypothetical protein
MNEDVRRGEMEKTNFEDTSASNTFALFHGKGRAKATRDIKRACDLLVEVIDRHRHLGTKDSESCGLIFKYIEDRMWFDSADHLDSWPAYLIDRRKFADNMMEELGRKRDKENSQFTDRMMDELASERSILNRKITRLLRGPLEDDLKGALRDDERK